jgi:hypothetical protein
MYHVTRWKLSYVARSLRDRCGVSARHGCVPDYASGTNDFRPRIVGVGHGQCRAARRVIQRGVTLLEVLFSMGIITVGLLGVMIIVPLAGNRAAQGMIADGADRLGRNAVRGFDVYQMRRPDSWAKYEYDTNSSQYKYQPFWGDEAFCIDPLYMAANMTTPATEGIKLFPYFLTPPGPASNVPWMPRVTLRTRPGATIANPPPTVVVPAMNVEQASQIFLGDDDLVFNLPTDRTLSPQQKFDSSVTKRQWEGKFSWLATLVPKQGTGNKLYLLSIVVFHRRDLTADAERRVDVAPVPAAMTVGLNGGDVLLSSTVKDDLKMKEGEWLMLSGIDGSSPARKHFQWYRIQTADAGPVPNAGGTGYERDLTLFGQDWQFGQMTGSGKTSVIWIPGIVAVYEKTIYLETSSMWTNL